MSWDRAGIERTSMGWAGIGWAGIGCLPYYHKPASSPVAAASLCRRTHALQAWGWVGRDR